MKLKKSQEAPMKQSKAQGKTKKVSKGKEEEGIESDNEDYLKVSATPNTKKVPAPALDSDEDDLDMDDEELDDEEDELDEEDSLDDEDADEDSEDGVSDEGGDGESGAPKLVTPKAKPKLKPASVKKQQGLEESDEDEEDEEDDEDFDEDESEEDEEEAAAPKKTATSKEGGKASKQQQPKRKNEEGPTEQASKKAKLGDGIPKSVLMDVDEYDKLFLYIGDIPKDCTNEDVKALSPDILDVRTNVKTGEKVSFVFAEFESEAVAERNLKKLQHAKLRGHSLRVGYRGAKRGNLPTNWEEVPNQLCVYNLPKGCSQDKVARLFPTATSVATMSFFTLVTFEDHAALLAAVRNQSCHKLDGHPLKFSYHLKPPARGKKNKKKKSQRRNRGPRKEGERPSKQKKQGTQGKQFGNKGTPKTVGKPQKGTPVTPSAKQKLDAKKQEVKKLAFSTTPSKTQGTPQDGSKSNKRPDTPFPKSSKKKQEGKKLSLANSP